MTKAKNKPDNHWHHPGGKLIDEGADKLSDAELLSILIGTGTKGKSAEDIAIEIIRTFGGYKVMSYQPLIRFLEFKGMGDVKIIRIAAAFEIARRILQQYLAEMEPDKKVIPKNSNEDVITWEGKIYRAITTGFLTQEQIDTWIDKNKERMHKIGADRKVVIQNGEDCYIYCNGRLYRALTSGIKSWDEVDEWVGNHHGFIEKLEDFLLKLQKDEKK